MTTVREALEVVDRLVAAAIGCSHDDAALLLYLVEIEKVASEALDALGTVRVDGDGSGTALPPIGEGAGDGAEQRVAGWQG